MSRHLVLTAAAAVLDREGIDGLTIRAVARELGRPPMSLYSHFDSKRALLDLVFDHILHRLLKVHHCATWQEEIGAGCRHVRRELLEHPNWVPLLTRVRIPAATVQVYEHLLGLMRKDGVGSEQAMFAISSVMAHGLGAVLVERMLGGVPSIPAQHLRLVTGMITQWPRRSIRRVAEASTRFDRWTFDRVFEFGLHSLVNGLDQFARRQRRPARRRAAVDSTRRTESASKRAPLATQAR